MIQVADSRQKFLDDIHRMEKAIQSTNSPYLKRDYQKAIKRKYQELRMYDKYQGENQCK